MYQNYVANNIPSQQNYVSFAGSTALVLNAIANMITTPTFQDEGSYLFNEAILTGAAGRKHFFGVPMLRNSPTYFGPTGKPDRTVFTYQYSLSFLAAADANTTLATVSPFIYMFTNTAATPTTPASVPLTSDTLRILPAQCDQQLAVGANSEISLALSGEGSICLPYPDKISTARAYMCGMGFLISGNKALPTAIAISGALSQRQVLTEQRFFQPHK